ncbi:hypothetical protein TWF281_011064 [Arthrobotrys megalospora]
MAENEELIHEMANQCKQLFASHTQNDPPSTIDGLLEDYQQQFLVWSAYMGVFADKSICLDRRLKSRLDIRDIVVRLLDILVDALGQVVNCNGSPQNHKAPVDPSPSEPAEDPQQLSDTPEQNELLEEIETSLSRLSHLGTTIRECSATSRTARVQEFAKQTNLSGFENLARMAADTLYPDADEGLRIQLTRSMVESYASILYKRSHQKKLNTPRVRFIQEISKRLMPEIAEGLDNTTLNDPSYLVGPQSIAESHAHVLQGPSTKGKQLELYLPSESTPSVIESLRTSVLKKYLDSSTKIESNCGASSVQIGRVTYPQPPKPRDSSGRLACEWCLESHPIAFFNNQQRWSAHIDKDFEPYVCISEMCMDKTRLARLPRYSKFKEWLLHMNTTHTTKWQQEIYKPISWVCSFDHSPKYFNTLEELHDHMKRCYPESLATSLQAIAKNSHIKRPRPHRVCPLCCRDLVQDKRRKRQSRASNTKRRKLGADGDDAHNGRAAKRAEGSDSDEQDTEYLEGSMARHIAEHLQLAMFLTIRLMKCHDEDDGSTENEKSSGADVGDRSFITSKLLWSSDASKKDIEEAPEAHQNDIAQSRIIPPIDTVDPKFTNGDYTLGWICALPLEMTAAVAVLDKQHPPLPRHEHDDNLYKFGQVGQYNIIIACHPGRDYGTKSAAAVVTSLILSFPSITACLMVGIGGGAPSPRNDIRLGDVVVSLPVGEPGGVLQYDFEATVRTGILIQTGVLRKPPKMFLETISALRAEHLMDGDNGTEKVITDVLEKGLLSGKFARPKATSDKLFEASYLHELGTKYPMPCHACDIGMVARRSPRKGNKDQPYVHYGLIASSYRAMRDGSIRNTLSRENGILCFEMEAAGVMNLLPALVIRGICDYSDSHRNMTWKPYAALAAAAFTKHLLHRLPQKGKSFLMRIVLVVNFLRDHGILLLVQRHEISDIGAAPKFTVAIWLIRSGESSDGR